MNSKKNKVLWILILGVLAVTFVVVYVVGMSDTKTRKTTDYSLWFVQRDSSEGVFGSVDFAYTMSNSSHQSDTALYRNILSSLTDQPKTTKLRSVFPAGIKVRTVTTNGNTLRINFSAEFNEMSAHEITLAKYCIAKTFSVFSDISHISIYVEGKLLANNGTYSVESYVTDHSQLSPVVTEVSFYRLSENRSGLSGQREKITWYQHNSLPEMVMAELMKDNAGGIIPQGTRLSYVYQSGQTVYVGFSPEYGSIDDAKAPLSIYSVVNTLSSIPDVAYVVISLGGEMNHIGNIPLDSPLLPNMSYVYSN